MTNAEVSTYQKIFKQYGYTDDNGATLLLRTQLLGTLKSELRKRNWTQQEAAKNLGVKQPRIAEIYALRIDKFSVELLVKYLFRLGKEVQLKVDDAHR